MRILKEQRRGWRRASPVPSHKQLNHVIYIFRCLTASRYSLDARFNWCCIQAHIGRQHTREICIPFQELWSWAKHNIRLDDHNSSLYGLTSSYRRATLPCLCHNNHSLEDL
jgi:hypothetical protein